MNLAKLVCLAPALVGTHTGAGPCRVLGHCQRWLHIALRLHRARQCWAGQPDLGQRIPMCIHVPEQELMHRKRLPRVQNLLGHPSPDLRCWTHVSTVCPAVQHRQRQLRPRHLARISARYGYVSELLEHSMRLLLIQACLDELVDLQLSRHAISLPDDSAN